MRIWSFYERAGRTAIDSGDGELEKKIERVAPNINFFLWRPVLSTPRLCRLHELSDGTYSFFDLLDMHEALDAINVLPEVKPKL